MATTIPKLSLTNKTAEEYLNEMTLRIPSLTDRWTNFNPSNTGMVILTFLAALTELQNTELDKRASELTIEAVQQRANAIRLLKLVGFQFAGKQSSRTTLRFSVPSAQAKAIPIVPYFDANPTKVKNRTTPAIYFSTIERKYLPAGNTFVDVVAVQGSAGSDSFTAASGVPDQIFTLTSKSIAEGTIKVRINNIYWKEVESFFESTPTSRHYQILKDVNGTIFVQTGDGNLGQIPEGPIEVSYVVSDGEKGNVFGTSKITELETTLVFVDNTSIPVRVSVTNTESAVGGEPEESLFHAKKVASRVYAAQKRAVTKDDFNAWAERFQGIRQAKTFDITDVGPESFIIDYFQIKIVIVPTDGTLPSAALKKGLQDYLQDLKDVPDNIEVVDPEYVPVTVSVDIFVDKPPVDPIVVKANVQTAIQDFFTPAEAPNGELLLGNEVEGQIFGKDVSIGELLAAIGNVDGVASVVEFTPDEDIPIDVFQIAALDGVPIVNVLGVV